MTPKSKPSIQKVKWRDMKARVTEINPTFAKVINGVDPNNKLDMYLVRYPFGTKFLNQDVFYVPTEEGKLVPLTDPSIPATMREQLGYNRNGFIPMGILLNRSVELFLHPEQRLIPYGMRMPGNLIGLWSILDPTISYHSAGIWNMTAGANYISMLPKISDSVSFKKLSRARSLKSSPPDNPLNHGSLMTQMAHHKDFAYTWDVEILFFSADWLKEREDNEWIRFHYFLYRETWEGSAYWRNKWFFDFIWDSFVMELTRQKIKVMPHVVDIVKHLIAVALGVLPGFAPALNDDEAPVQGLQEDFYIHYGLKKFAATIMVPRHFTPTKPSEPVYWSFQFPTHIESAPKPKTMGSVLSIMLEVHELLSLFCRATTERKLMGLTNHPIYETIKRVQFDFFHSESDPEGIVRLCREMPLEDKRLISSPKKFGKREFSEISPFVRGCVRISLKPNIE